MEIMDTCVRLRRTITLSLFSCLVLSFGGVALAATSPKIERLQFSDTKGTPDTSDDSPVALRAGFKSYRVAVDSKGNAYATDPETDSVFKYNANGHLVGVYRNIRIPLGLAVGDDGDIYVSGLYGGSFAIFALDQYGAIKGNVGLGTPPEIDIDEQGSIYTMVGGHTIKVSDKVGRPLDTFGPYMEKVNGPETIGSLPYSRTRHRLIEANGMAIDSSANEIYVTFREAVDYLSNAVCGGTNPNCYADALAYLDYANTDASYKYWIPAGERRVVAIIDKITGSLKRKIKIDDFNTALESLVSVYGVAVDGSRRLYVSTSQGVRVYDADADGLLTVDGSFGTSIYMDLSYDKKYKRMFATVSNEVVVYGIDGGSNPGNTAPGAPTLLEPANGSYVTSLTPALKIGNSSDPDADPLTYGYEIRNASGEVVSTGSGIPAGTANGQTTINISTSLEENRSYRWSAMSFDGNAFAWSDPKEYPGAFCVNIANDKPSSPAVISPVAGARVSPFSVALSWNPSSDPDCYDSLTYSLDISVDPAFAAVPIASFSLNGLSAGLAGVKGLVNGGSYYWRVKAVDNNGGASAYEGGSFTYVTTVTRFESVPAGAKVYIDGNYGYPGRYIGATSSTPLEVEGLTPGRHFITFAKDGYEPFHTIVDISDPLAGGASNATASAMMVGARRINVAAKTEVLVQVTEGPASPYVVDLNDDGLKDMIVGAGDGRVYAYVSEEQVQTDGSTSVVLVAKGALQADGADIAVGSRAVPSVVDYNNDGKKDLLIGSGDGLIYLYLNSGSDDIPVFSSAGTLKDGSGADIKTISNMAPTVVDYDNNGKKDIVAGGVDGFLRLYLNTGTDDSPIYSGYSHIKIDNGASDLSANQDSRAFFADWNSDGKKDIVVSGVNGTTLYLNVASDASPDFRSGTGLSGWLAANNWKNDRRRKRDSINITPFAGYNSDINDIAGAAVFLVDWGGNTGRDMVIGDSAGNVDVCLSGE